MMIHRKEIKQPELSLGLPYNFSKGNSRRREIEVGNWCYQVDVTQEDIDKGTRCACKLCPIALAMTRALGLEERSRWSNLEEYDRSYQIEAARSMLRVAHTRRLRHKRWYTPVNAVAFIKQYDNEKPVVPFTFYLGFQGWSKR